MMTSPNYISDICTSNLSVEIPGASDYPVSRPRLITTPNGNMAYGCDRGARDVNMDVVLIERDVVGIIDAMGGYGEQSSKALPYIVSFLQRSMRGELDFAAAHQQAEEKLIAENIEGGAVYLLLQFIGRTYNCISAGDVGLVHHNSTGEILFKSIPQAAWGNPINYIFGKTNVSQVSCEPKFNFFGKTNVSQVSCEPKFNFGLGSGKTTGQGPNSGWDQSPRLYEIGDRFIVASDGLWGAIKEDEAVELTKELPLEEAIRLLGMEAKTRMDAGKAKKDNLSIIGSEITHFPD